MILLILLLFGCFSARAFADNQTTWVYPPGPANASVFSGLKIHYGDTMNIQWTSTYPSSAQSGLLMKLWCGKNMLQPWTQEVPPNGTWPVPFTNLNFANWPLPLDCFFSLNYDNNGNGSTSFVLDNQDPNLSATTWSAIASAASSTSSSAATTSSNVGPTPTTNAVSIPTTSSAASPSSAATAAPVTSSGLSTSAKAGVAVGCIFGGVAFFGLVLSAVLLLKRERLRKQKEQIEGVKKGTSEGSSDQSPTFYKPELAADQHPPQEMPLVQNTGYATAPYEMPPEERSHQELPARAHAPSIYEMPIEATPRLNSREGTLGRAR